MRITKWGSILKQSGRMHKKNRGWGKTAVGVALETEADPTVQ
jgi:hypothetical protein